MAFTFFEVMKLDLRLQMVVKMVRPGHPVADIGTDHAYVPVFLVQNDIIPSALAGDVKVGPLANAQKTIKKYGLEDKIATVLSDGLKDVPHDYHDFVIAGMGGELISKLLDDSPWVKEIDNHFVLQPQTHAENLREYLFSNGFSIIQEDVVKDGRHLYLAMEVVYDGKEKTYSIADTYLGKLIESKSIYNKDYLKKEIVHLEKQFKATRDENIKELLDEIKEALS